MRDSVRQRIVDTAIRLLETEGPKAFGQTRVARAAEVQQGHLTYYFPRKADLVAAVLDRYSESGQEEFARVVAPAARLDAAGLRRAFFAHARALMGDKKRTRVLLSVLVEAQGDPDLAAVLDERGTGMRAVVGLLLGRAPDDVDVEIVLGALQGLGMRQLIRPASQRRIDAIVERLQAWLEALPPPQEEAVTEEAVESAASARKPAAKRRR